MIQSVVRLRLFGTSASRSYAKAILEDSPMIRQIRTDTETGELRLFLNARLKECDFVKLLAPSGISSFKIRF